MAEKFPYVESKKIDEKVETTEVTIKATEETKPSVKSAVFKRAKTLGQGISETDNFIVVKFPTDQLNEFKEQVEKVGLEVTEAIKKPALSLSKKRPKK